MSMTLLLICLASVVVAAFVLAAKGATGRRTAMFKARPMLTANELEFLGRLERAVPEYRFHAQVSMGALLEPAIAKKLNGREYMRARGMFSQKIVDFVAQRRDNGQIVAIIELDDRTHNAEKDAKRDAMLQQAGYRVMRWTSRSKPATAEILDSLVGAPGAQSASGAG